jgi:hypothetical protein
MNNDESENSLEEKDEPATVPGPASYEEELKDYSKTNEDDAIDNLPDSNPEPSPTGNNNT